LGEDSEGGEGSDDDASDGNAEIEEGEITVPSGAGAIVIDDSDVSDGASSHTDDSSDDGDEDGEAEEGEIKSGRDVRDNRSVSEDVDLYASDDDKEADSRYTAAMDSAAKRRKGKGKARGGDGAFSAALAEAEEVDELDSSSDEEAKRPKANGTHAASAGPSRTNSPPLRILGASASSAPTSPNGRSKRPEKWVRPAERAKYWAAKSAGEPIDLTHDSD
jgi:hypothetical protein